jgi:zinc protease
MGSGASSIINRTFVDKGLATLGNSSASNFQDVGLFTISLGFSPDKNAEELNKQLNDMVAKVKQEGVSQDDVDRIVAKINNQTKLSRDGSGSIAGQLTEAIAGGDWTDYIKGSERLSKVTAADVERVANKYLLENQSTTGYFIPEEAGSNAKNEASAVNFINENEGKYYFRNPEIEEKDKDQSFKTETANYSEFASAYENIPLTSSEKKYNRKEVAGIDVVSAKTGAKGFVTVAASFPIGSYIGTGKNEMVPNFTVGMLSKGTQLQDKFQFSEKLESLGVNIRINSDMNHVNISFKSLSEDVKTVLSLLAEELRQPLFDAKEFELLKNQTIDGLKRGLTDPGTLGNIAFSQAIYPKGHPNYYEDIETTIKQIEAVSLEDLKAFHKNYFGTAGMQLVAVGDVNEKSLHDALKKNFSGWKGGTKAKGTFQEPLRANALVNVVTIPKKPSAELFIGNYTGIEREHKDFMPFYIGIGVLGGGFAGRLMQTVRDQDGLTYGISARHSGHNMAGGYWSVNASFNPALFEKGLDATMVQIEQWVNKGITAEELASRKSNITGSFKVGMATTSGLANTLLGFLKRGLTPDYLNQYPKDVDAVTLDEVNQAIKKYIDLEKLIIIKAGSLNDKGEPLN